MSLTLFFVVLSVPVRPAQPDDLHRLYRWDEMARLESVLARLEANPKEAHLDALLAALKLHRDKIQGPAESTEDEVEIRFDMYGDAVTKLSETLLLHFDRLGKRVSPVGAALGEAILRDLLTGAHSPFAQRGLADDFEQRSRTLFVCIEGLPTGEIELAGSGLSLPFPIEMTSSDKIRESPRKEAMPVMYIHVDRLQNLFAANYSFAYESVDGRSLKTDFAGTILLRLTADGYIDAVGED